DAQAGRRRHQVLDRVDPRAVAADGRGVVRVDHTLRSGRDRVAVADAEDDAGISGCGGEGDPDLLTAVEADPLQRHRPPDRLLAHADAVIQQCKCHTGDAVESFVYKGCPGDHEVGANLWRRWDDTPKRPRVSFMRQSLSFTHPR